MMAMTANSSINVKDILWRKLTAGSSMRVNAGGLSRVMPFSFIVENHTQAGPQKIVSESRRREFFQCLEKRGSLFPRFGKNRPKVFQPLENSVDNETSQPQEKPVILLDLNFVPTWARQPAGKNPYEQFGGGERRDRGERREWGGERKDRRPRPGQRPGQGTGPGADGVMSVRIGGAGRRSGASRAAVRTARGISAARHQFHPGEKSSQRPGSRSARLGPRVPADGPRVRLSFRSGVLPREDRVPSSGAGQGGAGPVPVQGVQGAVFPEGCTDGARAGKAPGENIYPRGIEGWSRRPETS